MAEALIIPAIGWAISAANLVLSPILSQLVNKCFDALDLDLTSRSTKNKELAKKLEDLQTMLIPQLIILIDATQKSPHRRTLEAWLQRLKAAYSEAESLLTLLEKGGATTSKPNSKLKPSELTRNNRKKLILSLENIEKIVEEASDSKLVTMLNLSTNISSSIEYRETISTPGFEVVARCNYQNQIITLLCEDIPKSSSSNNAKCYSVIGICGMAGLGKTTLAQYVCKSEIIRHHFKLIIWVHVPQDFNVKSIFERIWESAFKEPCPDFKSAEGLQCKLQEKLKGQRFLLVLDDAWCDEGITEQIKLKFQQLFAPLQYAESNSKVLVTTRVEGAARALGASKLFQLQELDENEFMNLFRSHALCDVKDHAEKKHLESLEQIGDRLIKSKLYLSPLAATTMAAQLRRGLDQDPDYWSKLVKAHDSDTMPQQPEKTSTEASTSSAKRKTSTGNNSEKSPRKKRKILN